MKYNIDYVLNYITMYRLMLYYVFGLLIIAFGFCFLGVLPHDPMALAFSAVTITATCWVTNRLFAMLWSVPSNTESTYITALILVLILPPATSGNLVGVGGLVLASIVAVASKFLFAIGRAHIFNPVAIGVAVTALIIDQPATWWVGGNLALIPFVMLGGLVIARKVQRFDMIGSYIMANLFATALFTSPGLWGEATMDSLLRSPLLFAGFAMLTEPLTAPHAKRARIAYGVIIGVLSSPSIHAGEFYLTPELAFLAGNLFAYLVGPKGRFKLTLLRIEKIASGCYDFVFMPDRKLVFMPGQYLDWTLDARVSDNRGNRRPFTIASAPGDNEVRLGVKFYRDPSTFKRSLSGLKPGDVIFGSKLSGAFTLPKDKAEKLAFIAGGIGVTPFRSMVQDLVNRNEHRSVVMLYGNNTVGEIACADLFEVAERAFGMKTIYTVTENTELQMNVRKGFIDADLIRCEIPDYRERIFFVSGPRAMVVRFQCTLEELGIPRSRIKIDFFPGFA